MSVRRTEKPSLSVEVENIVEGSYLFAAISIVNLEEPERPAGQNPPLLPKKQARYLGTCLGNDAIHGFALGQAPSPSHLPQAP